MPRSRPIGVSFQVSPRKGKKPAPMSAQHLVAASDDLFDGWLTGEENSGQRSGEQRIWRIRRQQSAPTSPAMREPVCVGAQCRSRGEISVSVVLRGDPGEAELNPKALLCLTWSNLLPRV
jgi:hypothetical protein